MIKTNPTDDSSKCSNPAVKYSRNGFNRVRACAASFCASVAAGEARILIVSAAAGIAEDSVVAGETAAAGRVVESVMDIDP
jgi:hypothetical protein